MPRKFSRGRSLCSTFLNFLESDALLLWTNLTFIDFKSFRLPIDWVSVYGFCGGDFWNTILWLIGGFGAAGILLSTIAAFSSTVGFLSSGLSSLLLPPHDFLTFRATGLFPLFVFGVSLLSFSWLMDRFWSSNFYYASLDAVFLYSSQLGDFAGYGTLVSLSGISIVKFRRAVLLYLWSVG